METSIIETTTTEETALCAVAAAEQAHNHGTGHDRRVWGYVRVSTGKQDIDNQKFEIANFCASQGLQINAWIEETISGTKNYDKRKLGALLSAAQPGDLIICSELSRLGRSLFMIIA